MRYGSTSSEDVRDRTAYRKATNTTFAYTTTTRSKPLHDRKVHESVDPKRVNTLGEQIRECVDSPDHLLSKGAVIGFDQTGSMGNVPRQLQQNLATLKGATLRMGLNDLQLCFAAYGDAQNDEVAPCQVGQFESGIAMDDWLNNLYLECNGGGNNGETSGLLLYFLANYTKLDSLDKRAEKGYCILTGDELPLPKVTKYEIERYIGAKVQDDFTIEDVVKSAQKMYEVYFFLVDNSAAKAQGSEKRWKQLLGDDHVIVTQSTDGISDQIALLIATQEGVIDNIEDGIDALVAEGSTTAKNAGKELAHITGNPSAGLTVVADGELPVLVGSGNVTRL
jgi:hypothetical protein